METKLSLQLLDNGANGRRNRRLAYMTLIASLDGYASNTDGPFFWKDLSNSMAPVARDPYCQSRLALGCYYDEDDDDGDDYATWDDEHAKYLIAEEYIPASIQPKRGPKRMRRADRRWIVRNNGTVVRRRDGHHRGTESSIVFTRHHGYEPDDPYDNGTYRRQQIWAGVTHAALDQLNDDSHIAFFWE